MLGGYLAIRNMITVGDIQAFIQYVRSFTQPIAQLANISNVLAADGRCGRARVCLPGDEEEAPTGQAGAGDRGAGPRRFRARPLRLQRRQGDHQRLLASVEPGQRIAIVGPTGAGKTTMVKLLMRFYDVHLGAIRVDGHDIRDFRATCASQFGMVLQDTWLYNGTCWRISATGGRTPPMKKCTRRPKLPTSTTSCTPCPEGYHMVLNEEATNVSQGQKQLLTIARAVLATRAS
jgi:ATP-binding cassette, subfamily B, multidrug efflux pump